tara:strand:- start:52 stop:315 length:264 start_codon:yes stop_codon:yes gene_type:complete
MYLFYLLQDFIGIVIYLIIFIAIAYLLYAMFIKDIKRFLKSNQNEAYYKEIEREKRIREKALKEERERIRKENLISYGHDMKEEEED